MTGCCLRVRVHDDHDHDVNDGSDADNDHNDDNNDALFAGWCDVQAGSKVLRRSNRLNFGRQIHFKKHLPSFDLMKIRETNEKFGVPLQVCCSGDILAALPEPEPVVEEPVKIQCPSYR